MKVSELLRQLSAYGPDMEVRVADPVAGDCENISEPKLELDERYPAVVIFPSLGREL